MTANRRRASVAFAFGVLVLGLQSCAVCLAANAGVRPTQAGVVLGTGRLGGFRWKAETYRSKSAHAASRPCLHIGFRPAHRPTNPDPLEISIESTGCGPLHPTPDLVSLVDEVRNPKMTAIVMGFPLAVHSVSLYFNGHLKDRAIELDRLSLYKARKARINPFRYGTFAFTGDSCLSRFVAHSGTGRVVYDGGRMDCRVRS